MVFILLEHLLGTKRHTHILEPSYEVADEKLAAIEAALGRIVSGEPLQYVVGKAYFYGRGFRVSPSVLIPRPETEILCRTALDILSVDKDSHSSDVAGGPKVLDLCTGSGCIAWTIALERHDADVTGVDISDGALDVASSQDFSEEMSGTGAKAPAFIKADVLAEPTVSGQFDMILSNPPYVMDKEKALMRTNVLEHEPHLALFVSDEDPLVFYRAVARWASRLLSADGTGLVEINEALGNETAAVFVDAGFASAQVVQDFSGRDRFVIFKH